MATPSDPVGHAFISYVREDADRIKGIVSGLGAASIPAWTDKSKLTPGQDWRIAIRRAIQRNALAFIAVFSSNSQARETSYQHEELSLAVEQFRLHSPGRVWLIPVRLDVNRPGVSGDSNPWEGWSHVRKWVEEVSG